jgi:hypothetical protein
MENFNIKRATSWRDFGVKIRRVLLERISVHNIKRGVLGRNFLVSVINVDLGQNFDINIKITALQKKSILALEGLCRGSV